MAKIKSRKTTEENLAIVEAHAARGANVTHSMTEQAAEAYAELREENLAALTVAEQERKDTPVAPENEDMGTVDLSNPPAPVPLPTEQAEALRAGASADPAQLLAALEAQRAALMAQIEAQKATTIARLESKLATAMEVLASANKAREEAQGNLDNVLAELKTVAPERFPAIKGKGKKTATTTDTAKPERKTSGNKTVDVLLALADSPEGHSKGWLWENLGAGSALLGAGSKADAHPDTLLGRGLISVGLSATGRGLTYMITDEGREALARHQKGEGALRLGRAVSHPSC